MYGGITVLYVPISCDADARRASKHVVGGGTSQLLLLLAYICI
jgi:hypothetical protein